MNLLYTTKLCMYIAYTSLEFVIHFICVNYTHSYQHTEGTVQRQSNVYNIFRYSYVQIFYVYFMYKKYTHSHKHTGGTGTAQRWSNEFWYIDIIHMSQVYTTLIHTHAQKAQRNAILMYIIDTGWRSYERCHFFVGHFLQKSPIIIGSFAKKDLHFKASYASLPPCTSLLDHTNESWVRSDESHHTRLMYLINAYHPYVTCIQYTHPQKQTGGTAQR